MRFAQEIVMFSFILVLLVGIGSCVTPMPPIEEGALEVVVTSTSGQALQGALFESSEQYAYTDTQGRATLSLLPGTHEYSVSAQDHETRSGTEPVRAGSTNRIYVQLEALESPCETNAQCPQGTYCTPQGACVPVEEDGTLQVTVRGTSGALQGAMLTVGQRTAQTNTQGRATLSLEAGDYDYSISYPEYEPSWGTVDITAGETTSFGVDLVPVSTPECPGCVTITTLTVSGQEIGNPGRNAFDGDPSTRWSADTDLNNGEQYLEVEFDEPTVIDSVRIWWYKGTERTTEYAISTGTGQTRIVHSEGTAQQGEYHDYTIERTTQVLRITGLGNSQNERTSISEVQINGQAPDTTGMDVTVLEPGDTCQSDDDCQEGYMCTTAGECVQAPNTDPCLQCAQGEECVNGECVAQETSQLVLEGFEYYTNDHRIGVYVRNDGSAAFSGSAQVALKMTYKASQNDPLDTLLVRDTTNFQSLGANAQRHFTLDCPQVADNTDPCDRPLTISATLTAPGHENQTLRIENVRFPSRTQDTEPSPEADFGSVTFKATTTSGWEEDIDAVFPVQNMKIHIDQETVEGNGTGITIDGLEIGSTYEYELEATIGTTRSSSTKGTVTRTFTTGEVTAQGITEEVHIEYPWSDVNVYVSDTDGNRIGGATVKLIEGQWLWANTIATKNTIASGNLVGLAQFFELEYPRLAGGGELTATIEKEGYEFQRIKINNTPNVRNSIDIVLEPSNAQDPQVMKTLSVSKTGSGTVTSTNPDSKINCGKECSAQYPEGESVTLTATPLKNYRLKSWSSNCVPVAGDTNSCTVAMDAHKLVTATFEPAGRVEFTLYDYDNNGEKQRVSGRVLIGIPYKKDGYIGLYNAIQDKTGEDVTFDLTPGTYWYTSWGPDGQRFIGSITVAADKEYERKILFPRAMTGMGQYSTNRFSVTIRDQKLDGTDAQKLSGVKVEWGNDLVGTTNTNGQIMQEDMDRNYATPYLETSLWPYDPLNFALPMNPGTEVGLDLEMYARGRSPVRYRPPPGGGTIITNLIAPPPPPPPPPP
jgi:hypothetical protein